MPFTTLHVSTTGGVFTILSTYDTETKKCLPDAAFKTIEDDSLYIDNTKWIVEVLIPGFKDWQQGGCVPLNFIKEFDENILMTMSKNLGEIINIFYLAEKLKMY